MPKNPKQTKNFKIFHCKINFSIKKKKENPKKKKTLRKSNHV